MSQPKRYNLRLPQITYGMEESQDGEYVYHSDYAALAADRDKWKSWAEAENKDKKRDHADACDYIQMIVKEKNALAAENERLRKAGDAMAKHFEYLSEWNQNADGSPLIHPSLKAWLAAKEGRDANGCFVNHNKVAQYLPKPNAAKKGRDAK